MRHFLGGAPKYVAASGGGLPVSGARLWLDASDTATITHSSGAVSQWNDKSGNGFHVTQATAGNKPTTGVNTLNGMNVLTFDGGDFLAYSGSTGMAVSAVTVFAVFLESSAVSYSGVLIAHNGSGNDYDNNNSIATQTGDAGYAWMGDANSNYSGFQEAGAAPAGIHVARFASADVSPKIKVWRDGTVGAVSNGTTTFTGTAGGGWLVGARYIGGAPSTTYGLNGRIGEIIVYPSALSNADINTVANYLERWGNTWTDI